jgi:transglutaminase-like putative cysteine protease
MKIFQNTKAETKVSVSVVFLFLGMMIASCSGDHLINNKTYLADTENAFKIRKQLAATRDSALFSVFSQNLSLKQTEALEFLYAYMPLNDLADYNGDFFLANINISLKAISEASWGKEIPEDVFLHYVLPYRINNENLDSFRIECYDEIRERVKGKDIKSAALEINHWCHEKVIYQASDIRTSSPLNTILSARGRCGEESTFTVAALRTAGIPARQVYTPRWAHTDDNHAWVEIWADGKWYYMGACEPEPELDRGWFTEPARRAMLVHTKSFGANQGSENAIIQTRNFTNVNNLEKYAVTKKITVKVVDENKIPVKDAIVEYQLYNYAEFYPLAKVPSDKSGISQFETGLGDLLIWAHKNDDFDFRKISVGETDTLTLMLNRKISDNESIDLDLDIPVIHKPFEGPSKDLIDRNAERIKSEDAIRQKYINTWIKPGEVKSLKLASDSDTTRVLSAVKRSMGNYKEIIRFIKETPDSLVLNALSMLEVLPDKDLRDSKSYILLDHLLNAVRSKDKTDEKMFIEYVLNPRVANEQLVSWRKYLLTNLPSPLVTAAQKDPSMVTGFLNENIKIADEENYYGTPLTPVGVIELKVSDKASRAISLVAICRTLGIPARLEPGRNIPQYFIDNKWNDVYFSDQKHPDLAKGFLKLQSPDTKPVPEYYTQFTIGRFEGGRYNTLEYDFNKKITDFKEELPLPPGHYMLVTGNRQMDGRILSNISFFALSENEHKTINVSVRKDLAEKKLLGKADLGNIFKLSGKASLTQSCTKYNGQVIIWTDPEQEPTKHIFNDLPLLKAELDAWGGNFLFLSDSGSVPQTEGMPDNSAYGADKGLSVMQNYVKFNSPVPLNLPLVLVTDKEGNIVYLSSGYRIGIGEQILKALR